MSRSRLVLRADGGDGRGVGHVVRCVALAEAWGRAGGEVTLLVSSTVADRAGVLAPGLSIVSVSDPVGSDQDADRLASHLDDQSWLVLDGYSFGPGFAERASAPEARTVIIDDHGGAGHHRAAVIVDQNPGVAGPTYRRRPSGSTLLLGPRYSLLRRRAVPDAVDRAGPPRRLLVALGGDPTDALVEVVRHVVEEATDRLGLEVDVMGGGDHAALGSRPGVTVHGFVADPTVRFAEADLAFAAAGTISWELCRWRLPSVVVASVDNQQPVGAALVAAGAALSGDTDGGPGPVDQLARLVDDPDLRRGVAEAAGSLVDGRGAERVVAAIRSRTVRLRPAGVHDARVLWTWANDPDVRAAAFDPRPIPWIDHQAWFTARSGDPGAVILVAEHPTGAPWGQVRIEWGDTGTGLVDVSVAKAERGDGRAAPLIRAGLRRAFTDNPGLARAQAHVRAENHRSAAAFSLAGLDRVGETEGVLTFEGGRDDGW